MHVILIDDEGKDSASHPKIGIRLLNPTHNLLGWTSLGRSQLPGETLTKGGN